MKPQEILFASAVIAAVAGVGAALATRAFESKPARSEVSARGVESDAETPAVAGADATRALDDLRMENAALRERMASLEARLSEAMSSRTPLATSADALRAPPSVADDSAAGLQPLAVTPAFVASVGQALDTIRAQEDAEREQKRKELQAQRIEDRVAKLQQELGLNSRQASDLRTALITADDKREALFASMRDMPPGGPGDGRDMREGFRAIREETHTALQATLTPEQFEAYKASEDSEFGRRGFDFGGGRPPDGGMPGGGGGNRGGGGGDGRRGR